MIIRALRSIRLLLLMLVLCCVIYPLLIYILGITFFPRGSKGSIITHNGVAVGSPLIGQQNQLPNYFWPRPSFGEIPYDPKMARASHAPFNSATYNDLVKKQYDIIRAAHPYYKDPVPIDIITYSASGLDPHISKKAALLQAERVAKARKLKLETVQELIAQHTQEKQLGVLGKRRVNVLMLNLELDALEEAK